MAANGLRHVNEEIEEIESEDEAAEIKRRGGKIQLKAAFIALLLTIATLALPVF